MSLKEKAKSFATKAVAVVKKNVVPGLALVVTFVAAGVIQDKIINPAIDRAWANAPAEPIQTVIETAEITE